MRTKLKSGFTLVEIMIVVCIIGLLAVIAIPSFAKARRKSSVTRAANDLRVLDEAFKMYSLEMRSYPPDANNQNGVLTGNMDEYVRDGIFEAEETPIGGRYRWINKDLGLFAYAYIISYTDCTYCGGPANDLDLLASLDELIDDGDPTKGILKVYVGVHYHYIVELK